MRTEELQEFFFINKDLVSSINKKKFSNRRTKLNANTVILIGRFYMFLKLKRLSVGAQGLVPTINNAVQLVSCLYTSRVVYLIVEASPCSWQMTKKNHRPFFLNQDLL